MNFHLRKKTVLITGPTASGKTRLAARLALEFGGEIISADSRQVFRRLDIGTGKDLGEYIIGTQKIPFHLIDIVDPECQYNLMQFCADFKKQFNFIVSEGKIPFVAGGSPLYISAIINDYSLDGGPPDIELREKLKDLSNEQIMSMINNLGNEDLEIDVRNRNRLLRIYERLNSPHKTMQEHIDADWLIIGTFLHRKEVHGKIRARLAARLADGMINEVERLHESGLSWEKLEYFGLEYKWVSLYLQKKIDLETMKNTLEAKIRQFARRQDIWFRKLERQGWKIHWKKPDDYASVIALVKTFLADGELPEPDLKISDIYYGSKTS